MLKPTHSYSNGEYQAHPAISRSDLMLMQRSPRHFWQRKFGGGRPSDVMPTPALLLGTAVHAAVLEPKLFDSTYIEAPRHNKNTNVYKAAAAEAKAAGQIMLSPDDITTIHGIVRALREHETAAKALYGKGISEANYITEDGLTGLQIKCRADRVTDSDWLVDLKTTTDASEHAFTRTCINFNYHVQAAHYLHTVEQATGIRPKGFLFVAVEKVVPYGVQVFKMSDLMLEVGHNIVANSLADIKQHIVNYGIDTPWPCYSQKISKLELPAWAQR